MNDTTHPPATVEGTRRLALVAALLHQTQHELLADPSWDTFGLSLGTVMDLAEDVLELVAAQVEVEHRPARGADPLLLLRRAEDVLTGLSITAYPPGTSQVVSGLIDAVRETAVRRGLPYPPAGSSDE